MKVKRETTDNLPEDADLSPTSASPPQRITDRKRPNSVDSPFLSRRSGRKGSWDKDVLQKRVKPDPLEVMCKAFPGHGRDVLERILTGCGGNVVQAIECVLENEGPTPLHAPIPIMPSQVPGLPPVIYSGYNTQSGVLRGSDGLPPYQADTRMSAMYQSYSLAPQGGSRTRGSPQALTMMPYAHALSNKGSKLTAEEKEQTENGSNIEMKKSFCTNCGHKLQENDNFCGNCGQRITL